VWLVRFFPQPCLQENNLKRLSVLFAAFCIILFTAASVRAQQFDVAFGYSTVGGNAATDASPSDILSGNHTPQSIAGGGYPAFSGDFLFYKKYFGVGGNVAWRAHENVDIFTTPYRPILYDFNAVWAPALGKHAQAEVQGGIGAESLRFYTPFVTCNFVGCTNYTSSTHFLTHVGGGFRFYIFRDIFIRPEAHYYFVRNNFEFAGPRVTRYGASIGYSLRNKF
jgi:hypothetical protein